LWTGAIQNIGPMTLQFANPLSGVGAQIQGNPSGPYTATLKVFSPTDTLLGTFTVAGNNSEISDNTAPFLGVIDTQREIGKIVYSVNTGTIDRDVAINRLDLRTSLAPIPEPSTLVLLASGLPAFVGLARRRATRR
ncbi:MAG TPA: PEP-CTERM sorting domain-containing protein, partial [bacterium]